MKKILVSIVAILVVFSFVGCDIFINCSEKPSGQLNNPPENNENKKYWGYKALDSFEDLTKALKIINSEISAEKYTYTVDDTLGEEYKVVYLFSQPGHWISYPISFNEYFNSVTNPSFVTYIFSSGEKCKNQHSEYFEHMTALDNADPDKEKYGEYRDCSVIRLFRTAEMDEYVVKMEDRALFSITTHLLISESPGNIDMCEYDLCYDGKPIFRIESCKELTEKDFDLIINHIEIIVS